ncbi:MAG: UDP-N-acetylmuramoyl-L-alanyl-D-glutamate--2,6-diaminopimelate ligase [Acidobacteria bacterium]|nr:UDP-N-acetylmuramoyl-L-alanyl-D-glutamate--2,6-diaminopimelate ligase [Acidobacteriota bacterium]MBV9476204.1 UDP-N-acetylmuramoyl-L-alanyl-D-glutamate--2,6-diaminopimelate ligase [Acidobacteriota bacterium]
MKLAELLRDAPVRAAQGALDVDITSVTPDSRLVRDGALFVAIPGTAKDGTAFIPQAIEKGAAAIVATDAVDDRAKATIVVDDPRAALALLAANFYGRPAEKLSLVGITGTSGKTTSSRMVESIFDAGSEPVGLIGTIEYRAGDERLVADRTTPDAVVLQEWFAKMVDAGVHHAVMEVSSHALALKRTYGIHFAAAVFTNLSREHFDFHKDFEDYFAAKKILFTQIDRSRQTAVVNIDDEYGRRLANELGPVAMTFGRNADADLHPADGFVISVDGLHGTVVTPRGDIRIASRLLGLPNLYNWLGAIGAALIVGIPVETIEAGIRNLTSVRGRFERVAAENGPTVIVDYAHKPDALEKLLHAVREIAGTRRVSLVFGCGGDRDRGKRPEMGAIAARLADNIIVTSDNPRSEEPRAIIEEITKGIAGKEYLAIADRREAIAKTIAEALPDDVIVIAGKGHETYQVVGDQVIHFDDREEAELALKKRHA